jgi:DNA repair exonuclease SbcCD nuclease subunit
VKIAVITDQHFGARKSSKNFHDYFLKFYENVFFPILNEKKIDTIIDMGDTFDNRKYIDFSTLYWAKENYYDRLKKMNCKIYTIVGNHTSYYKNSNEINAIDTLLQQYDNVIPISKPAEYTIEGMKTVLLPWICTDNEKETFELLDETEAKVVFGHLELNGFTVYPGHVHVEGLDKKVFQKFDRVYSGHYHTRSDDGKIFYLGNPYQMFWNDVNDKRGFHIFDTDDYKLDYYQNPYTMFERVYYENNNPKDFDASHLTDKMVKIIVRQRDDYKMFDKFVDAIVKVNPLELKIVENVDVYDEDVNCDEIPTEDTLSILDKYVEESEFELDKNTIKKLLREFYKEALEVE